MLPTSERGGEPGKVASKFDIPTDYLEGYSKSLEAYGARAANYIAHTRIGDPTADELMNDLSTLPSSETAALLAAALNEPDAKSRISLPQSLQSFIREAETVPRWVNHEAFRPAYDLFHRDSYLAIAALTGGTLVEGFSTNIAKSFFITGRIRDSGVRRLQQNNRHMIEIFLPGGLTTRGDGWKLSVRLRLVHARVRFLLMHSEDWDLDAWGTPLCAAHLGFAASAFSARMLQHLRTLGSQYSMEEQDSFMAVWRYTAYLMGIPETILFKDFDDAIDIFRVGQKCEPPPSAESVAMAHSLINSAPLVANATDPAYRQQFAKHIFLLSRALVGDSLANSLNYPNKRASGILPLFRLLRKIQKVNPKLVPNFGALASLWSFGHLLDISDIGELDITYFLPNHIYHEKSNPW